jgi:hypothetical protein
MHLNELEVLAVAEGERDDLREHVDSCEVCARAVAEQVTARDALRSAELFQAPPLEHLVAALPERARTRRLTGWPRAAAILAPVAAGAIAIAVVTTRGEEQRPAAQPEAATAMKAQTTAQEDSARAAAPVAPAGWILDFPTAEPAENAAAKLRRAGFTVDVYAPGTAPADIMTTPGPVDWQLWVSPPDLEDADRYRQVVDDVARELGGERAGSFGDLARP